MAVDTSTGPLVTSGDLLQYFAGEFGAAPVPDSNPDRSPSMFFQGTGLPDVRLPLLKDKLGGFTGVAPMLAASPKLICVNAVPAAHTTTKVAAAQHATSGTALTLASAQAAGATPNVPIIPWSAALNGQPVTVAPLALDFGFAFGNCTAGSATIVVADSTQFVVGMPLVIAGVGNSGGTAALLTQVAGITDATHITVPASAKPLATNSTAPIGTGNIWGPSPAGWPLPTAAYPGLGVGPGLWMDPTQMLSRGLVITASNALGVGGNIVVSGWTAWGEPITETIAIAPGTAVTAYGVKAFKYIKSAVPNFTDVTYNYSIGTSDVFGAPILASQIETSEIWWAAGLNIAATGFTAGSATPATADARGTIQTSAIGGGSGIGSTASSGSINSLVMTGNRLFWAINPTVFGQLFGRGSNPVPFFGATPA